MKATIPVEFQLPHSPLWKRARRRIAKRLLSCRYRHFTPDSEPDRIVLVAGIRLHVARGVFDPSMHFTSGILAKYLQKAGSVERGSSVLDLGTGSGVAAIAAACSGAARVVALDINPDAVECTRLNSEQNHVEGVVVARESDLFSAAGNERFDLVICNPPYFRGEPRTMAEHAYFGGEGLEWIMRFGIELGDHLTAAGSALVSIGDAADIPAIVNLLQQCGWSCKVVALRDILVETIYIFKLARREEDASIA